MTNNKKHPIDFYSEVDLDKEALKKIFVGKWVTGEKVYIKIHFGEPGNKTAFNVEFVRPYIEALAGMGHEAVLWDCPVFYPSPRQTKAGYEKVVEEKGFNSISTTEICDEYIEVEADDEKNEKKKKVLIAKIITRAKNLLVLTHVKGHGVAGFGGAIKNVGIGAVAPETKGWVHEMEKPGRNYGFNLETLGKVVTAALNLMPQNTFYVNVIKDVTLRCDCAENPGKIIAPNLGTLVSQSMVAIDRASLDLLNEKVGYDLFTKEIGIDPAGQIEAVKNISQQNDEYELSIKN